MSVNFGVYHLDWQRFLESGLEHAEDIFEASFLKDAESSFPCDHDFQCVTNSSELYEDVRNLLKPQQQVLVDSFVAALFWDKSPGWTSDLSSDIEWNLNDSPFDLAAFNAYSILSPTSVRRISGACPILNGESIETATLEIWQDDWDCYPIEGPDGFVGYLRTWCRVVQDSIKHDLGIITLY